jgi:trypsin
MKSILLIAFFTVCLSFNIGDETEFPIEVLPITEELVNATFASMAGRVDIVGGTVVASAQDYPFQAAYQRTSTGLKCGGSIISPYYILTAAHCIESSSPRGERVSVGSLRFSGTTAPAPKYHEIAAVYKHPQYNSGNVDYDVAILELSTPIVLGPYTQVVRIAPASSPTFDGQQATILGWGTTSESGQISQVLREVQIPVISNSACNSYYGAGSITARMLCAYDANVRKDSCQGDSGGPAVIYSGSTPQQVGIVSWGQGCARVGYPGVYTRVSSVHSWICQNAPGAC